MAVQDSDIKVRLSTQSGAAGNSTASTPAASIVRTACCPSAVRPSWATGSVSHTARCRSCAAMLCCKDAIA